MHDEREAPDHHLTRRQALAAAGAAVVAGAALSSPAASAAVRARPRPRRADVLVIGGGLAGLQAARSLVARGRSVLVLEARTRVGGRTLNKPLGRRYPGEVVEVGGQWVGPTQDRLLALAQELEVSTFKTYDEGQGVLLYQGARTPFDLGGTAGPIPPVPDSLIQTATAIAEIDRLAATIDVRRPWAAPDATALDGQTFETFRLGQATSPGARFLLDLGFTSVFATEPRDVSLLWALFYIASAGNERTKGSFLRLLNTAGGAQERRFRGGSQQIALRMAAALGRRVVLGTPARRVDQDRAGVEVTTDHGTYRGRHAILALPPTLAGRLVYEPALPVARDGLTQRMPMGVVIKVNVVYPEPFWRAAGLAGYTNTDSDCVRLTYDNSPPDGRPGILLAFIEGEKARLWGARTPAARRAAVLRDLVAAYGPRAARPTGYIEQSWAAEPYSRGCYGGYAPPGLLTAVGPALREPVGRIHWAGTETSDYWNGYMEGALRSGARAADEV